MSVINYIKYYSVDYVKMINCLICNKTFEKSYHKREQTCSIKCLIKNNIELKNGCWIQTRSIPFNTKCGGVGHGRPISYKTFIGDIPKNHVVQSKCDNKYCINPFHLFTKSEWDIMCERKERERLDEIEREKKNRFYNDTIKSNEQYGFFSCPSCRNTFIKNDLNEFNTACSLRCTIQEFTIREDNTEKNDYRLMGFGDCWIMSKSPRISINYNNEQWDLYYAAFYIEFDEHPYKEGQAICSGNKNCVNPSHLELVDED